MNLADRLYADAGLAAAGSARRIRSCETLVVGYEADAGAIAALLPPPLRPDGSNAVSLRFTAAPADVRGVDVVAQLSIDAELDGMPVQYVVRSWAEAPPAGESAIDPSLACGRARLIDVHDQLTAVLESGGRVIAIAAVDLRRHLLASRVRECPAAAVAAWLARPQVFRPLTGENGYRAARRLATRRFVDIQVQHAVSAADLDLVGDFGPLPLRSVLGAAHFVADLTVVTEHSPDSLQRRRADSEQSIEQEEVCA